MQLTVNTSFWTRYRSDSQNTDLGDTLPQAVPDLAVGQHPAIPRSDADLHPKKHLQAIANTAGFHFAWVEQGGTASTPRSPSGSPTARCCGSCLASAAPRSCTSRPAGQGRQRAGPDRPHHRAHLPDLNADGELTQTNLIMPEPTIFLDRKFRSSQSSAPPRPRARPWARSKP